MVSFRIRTIVMLLGALGLAASVALSAAQASKSKAKSSDLLTTEQVKELIANADTPAEHLKLSHHFSALAVKFEAEAANHEGEAKLFKRASARGHCERLVQLLKEAGKEARELAADHEQMAQPAK